MQARKARKTTVNGRVNSSPGLKSSLRQYFTTPETRELAVRILHTYDQPGTCQDCLYPECDGYCHYNEQYDSSYFQQVQEVKTIIAENFHDLGHAMRLAVHEEEDSLHRAVMAPVNAESFLTYSHDGGNYQEDEQSSSGIFDDLVADSNQNWPDDANPDKNQDWSQDKTEQKEEHPSLLNDAFEEAPDTSKETSTSNLDDAEEDLTWLDENAPNENFDQKYYDDSRDDHNANYFTVGIVSEENPMSLLMDSMMGLEIFSEVYSLLCDNSPEQSVRRSNITECTSKIDMPDSTTAIYSIKVDSCNSRMLAGKRFLQGIDSCYAYGLPPIRMKTTSKQPTTWKRDVGRLHYHDENNVKCVSLVYVDYDNPDLILMDLNTILDAEVDLQYHATTSRDSGIVPLRRGNKDPYHYGDFSKQTEPLTEFKPPSSEDKNQPMDPSPASVRTLRRSSRSSTKKALLNRSPSPERSRAKPGPDPDDECTCEIRRVDSLLTEDYHRLVDDLSELNLRRFNSALISSDVNNI